MAIFDFVKNYLTKREGLKEYDKTIKKFLADNELSADEKSELKKIQDKFKLSDKDIKDIQKNSASQVFLNISTDKRISAEEKKSLEKLLEYFDLNPEDIKFNQAAFNKYYSLALIDKNILPTVNNPEIIKVILKKEEILHFGSFASLRKLKKVTKRINYGGFTGSIKIMKGVRYRVGSIGVRSQSEEVLALDDTGSFYITSDRIGYIGYRKQFSFPHKKLGSIELRNDGLYIFKDGKELPYILNMPDYEVPLAIISFILNNRE